MPFCRISAPVTGTRRPSNGSGTLHFNAIQFYDWMYRHDALLPPADRFRDPLGREMDLSVIREKIAACKTSGIRPIAYGAIYAADKERFQAHPEWGMYTLDGQPMTFAGWLYYMNIARSCGWSDHILEEYRKAIAFGFSGIHMDTYGFPKQVWDNQHRPVDLAEEIPTLIDRRWPLSAGRTRRAVSSSTP